MKNLLKRLGIVSLALLMLLLCFTACDTDELPGNETPGDEASGEEGSGDRVVLYSLVLESNKTELARGESATLSATLKAEGKETLPSEDAVYEIVSGKDYATILNNVVTVLSTAPHNAEIKVRAKEGATYSNELVLKVSVPATALTIAAGGVTNVSKGQSVILTSNITPQGANSNIVWSITQGSEYASISSNILVISSNAPTGTKIKLHAAIGELVSNELVFDVGYVLDSIVISPLGEMNILPGNSAQVNVIFNPSNATDKDYELVLVEACEGVSLHGNVILVSTTANVGDEIKVKAVSGGKESNVLTYVVGYPLTGISISASGATNIVAGGETTVLVTIDPANATNGAYRLVFTNDCAGYAEIVGNTVKVLANAISGAQIKVKAVSVADDTIVSNEITYTVGYPPESLSISAGGVTNVLAGSETTVTVTTVPNSATNRDYRLVFTNDCAGYAEIVGNTVKVLANAISGAQIKVKAVSVADDTIVSNEITYTVGYPPESLSISAGGVTNVLAGGVTTITVTAGPNSAINRDYRLVFTNDCAGYAEIVGNTILVSTNAATGAQIKVQAVSVADDTIVSGEITYTVGYPVERLTISAAGVTNILAGKEAEIFVTVNPANTTNGAYRLVFTNDCAGYAEIVGNTVKVLANAISGAQIKVKAVSVADDTIVSNEITYTVGYPPESISISAGGVNNLLAGGETTVIVTVVPNSATNRDYRLVFTNDCAGYAEIVGNTIKVLANAISGAQIKVQAVSVADDTIVSNEITYTVGYPPESLSISAGGMTNVLAGSEITIAVTTTPNSTINRDYRLVLTNDCAGYAEIVGNTIKVLANALTGKQIKVQAVSVADGTIVSNEITLTVGYPVESLTISAGVTNILAGNEAEILVTIDPANATNGAYRLVFTNDCAGYAEIVGNTIKVSANALTGKQIKVQAVSVADETIVSNEITLTVGYPVESLTISSGVTNILAGNEAEISVTIDPANATNGAYRLVFTNDCAGYAEIVGNTIKVLANALTGKQIKVQAVSLADDTIVSNEITLTVGYPLESLAAQIGSAHSASVLPGHFANLYVTLVPANTTNGAYTWEFIDGADYATIVDGKIVVKEGTPLGTVIRFKAVSAEGDVSSNELTIVVNTAIETITISSTAPAVLDRGQSYSLFVATVPTEVNNAAITWIVTEGAEWAYVLDGKLYIRENFPAGATVKVVATSGTVTSNELSYTVGVKLDKVEISIGGKTELNIEPGAQQAITLTKTPVNASDNVVNWVIEEGAGYASIINGMITVLDNKANVGKTVKLYAEIAGVKSNTITVTIGVVATDVAISIDGKTELSIEPGEAKPIVAIVSPSNATIQTVDKWVVIEGEAYATVANGMITVINSKANIGKTVKFYAEVAGVQSNIITVTIGVVATDIEISIGGKTELSIEPGETKPISAVVAPTNATIQAVEKWVITEGNEYVSIVNGMITVINSKANIGKTVTFCAEIAGVRSNTITVTIGVVATDVAISIDGKTELSIEPGEAKPIVAIVSPSNATIQTVDKWVVIEGEAYVTVANGMITVNNNKANVGKTVQLCAEVAGVQSNIITITIGVETTGIEISIAGKTELSIEPGDAKPISATILPNNATIQSVEKWVIKDGEGYATISQNGVITILNEKQNIGKTVTFYAEIAGVKSNTITVTIGVVTTDIEISIAGKTELSIEPGDAKPISAIVSPSNATLQNVEKWVIEKGGDYATISQNGVITILNEKANVGKTIEFYAMVGGVKSNTITVTVGVVLDYVQIAIGNKNELSLEPGDEQTITAIFRPSNATIQQIDRWVIEEGGDYATISEDGVITIHNNKANVGKTVKFYAMVGEMKSNPIIVTIGVELAQIEIAVGSKTEVNIEPGDEKAITAIFRPSNATIQQIDEWVIDDGEEYATITNGIISIAPDAPIGAEIKFYAVVGEVKSNVITVTVGTPITEIVISTPGSTEIVKGNSAELEITLTPGNASEKLIKWEILSGAEWASISKNNMLTVSKNTPTGAEITVRATFSDKVYSNEITFTVMPTQEEMNAEKYFLQLSTTSVTVDKFGTKEAKVVVKIFNGLFEEVTDRTLTLFVNGTEYLSVIQSGYELTFAALGHGEARVTVGIEGTNSTASIDVDVIVPPEAILLPEVFAERTDIEYDFSMKQPGKTEYEQLPFLPVAYSQNALACKEFEITFTHASGVSGDDVAVYEDGKITFKMTGKVTAIITSKSGSYMEAKNVYTFDINEGYNVHNYIELYKLFANSKYNGQIINLVVTEKPVGETSYAYGYDLVPPTALKDPSNQTIENILYGVSTEYGTVKNRLQIVNKSIQLNGNNHKINASQLRTFTKAEYTAHLDSPTKVGSPHHNLGSLFSVEPWTKTGADTEATMGVANTVRIENLEVVGNCTIDYPNYDGGLYGAYDMGILIGEYGGWTTSYTMDYYVYCDNLTMSQFEVGMKIEGTVGDSKISNITAYNCFASALRVQSAIIKLENMTFGKCGACIIEVSPDFSDKAGVNENENSQITFAGSIIVEDALNNGNTEYFNKFTVAGARIPDIILYNVSQMTQYQQAHIMGGANHNEFIFVSLILDNTSTFAPNTSVVDYPAYQAGGIVQLSELTDTINTTHQYVSMDVYAPIPSLGTVKVGTAIFYNMNYQGN